MTGFFAKLVAAVIGNAKLMLYGLGVAAAAAAYFFIRQSGADAEKAKQANRDLKAASTIGKARAEARSSTDAELDKEVDRWTRR